MNRQRGFIPVAFIPWIVYGLIGVAILAALATVAYKVNHWHNAAWEEEHAALVKLQAAWDADKAARIQRTTEITLELSGKLSASMDAQTKREGERNAAFVPVSARVQAIPRGPSVALPANVAGVLDAAARAGNTGRADFDAGPETRTDPIPETAEAVTRYDQRELAEFLRDGPLAYADAYGLWKACREREEGYLAAFAKGASPVANVGASP